MQNRNNNTFTYTKLIIGTGLWGGAFVFGSIAARDLSPYYLACIRFIIASIALLILTAATRQLQPIRLKEVPMFAALGLTGIAGYNILFFLGLKYSSASVGALLIATGPLWTNIFSAILLREKLTPNKIIGIIIALCGVTVILNRGLVSGIKDPHMAGNIFFLLSSVCWSIYSIIGKISLKRFTPLTSTTYASIAGTVFLLPFALAQGFTQEIMKTTTISWISIAYLSLLATVIGFVFWYSGVNKLGAARTSIFLNLVPVWGVILPLIFLGESLTVLRIIGSFLVITGILVVQLFKPQPKRVEA